MALITPNDGVNDPNSAAVLDVATYFCRPNDSSLSPKRPISGRPNGHLGKNLSPKRLSSKRLVAQMTVDPSLWGARDASPDQIHGPSPVQIDPFPVPIAIAASPLHKWVSAPPK